MEEVTMMTMSKPEDPMSESLPLVVEPITATTSPSWKLYENPFYNSPLLKNNQQEHQHRHPPTKKELHHISFPLSTRKLAASFWDLTFFRPIMEAELELARTQILELKAELEYERKVRKKAETMSKRLAKDLSEERRGREALERVCEKLAREVSSDKTEIDRMKKGFEEERKMLRMAEVLREERVQMKLAEAKFLFEEKLSELEATNSKRTESAISDHPQNKAASVPDLATVSAAAANLSGKFSRLVLGENSCDDYSNNGGDSREPTRMVLLMSEKSSSSDNSSNTSRTTQHRRASPESENPHIMRGIKGFVEFPRVIRAIGSKSRHWGTKLECQKAQLRILLKQKSPIRSNNLIIS